MDLMLYLALATAAISLTISKTRAFATVREAIMARNDWLGHFVGCPYCVSHWVSFGFVVFYRDALPVGPITALFAIVGASALVCGVLMNLIWGES